MKNIITIILALIAIVAAIIGFQSCQAKKALEADDNAQLTEIAKLQADAEALAIDAKQAQAEANRLKSEAAEAARMAQAKQAKDEADRAARIDALNQRLAQEAAERKQAEAQTALLEQKMEALVNAQAEATARLKELESTQQSQNDPNSAKIAAELNAVNAQLAKAQAENDALKERQQILLNRQIKTEEAIIAEDGEIRLPIADIRSPDNKRYQSLNHRRRVEDQQ